MTLQKIFFIFWPGERKKSFIYYSIMAAATNTKRMKRIILLAAIGVLASNRSRQLIKKKQIKRFWRRGIFRDRKLHSEYYTLYQNLRDNDREFHYRYVRTSGTSGPSGTSWNLSFASRTSAAPVPDGPLLFLRRLLKRFFGPVRSSRVLGNDLCQSVSLLVS